MLVPRFLYGRFRDVKAACNRKVTQLKRGASWDDLAGDLIDTRDFPGLLVLDGPSSLLGGADHFHFFAPAQVITDAIPRRLPEDTLLTLFEPAIATNWGFLTMLSQWAQLFLWHPGHQQRFLHLLVRWWDELDAEGPRYSTGSNHGEPLWPLPTNIQYCLVREGLPDAACDEAIPAGGMAELVARTRAGLPPSPGDLH